MGQIFDIAEDYNLDADAIIFTEKALVGDNGRAQIQIEHDFSKDTAIVYPLISINGSSFAGIYREGVRIETDLTGEGDGPNYVSGIILTDLLPGSWIKAAFERSETFTGRVTIKILT